MSKHTDDCNKTHTAALCTTEARVFFLGSEASHEQSICVYRQASFLYAPIAVEERVLFYGNIGAAPQLGITYMSVDRSTDARSWRNNIRAENNELISSLS